MARIKYITGTIRMTDGTESAFSIQADAGWQQWGAGSERLAETVDVLDAMAQAAAEYVVSDGDDDAEVTR